MNDVTVESVNKELRIKNILREYQFGYIKNIGSGAYGDVVEVERNGIILAAKVINKNIKKIHNEIVEEFRGKNLVKIMYKLETDSEYFIYVMERSYVGSLDSFRKNLNRNLLFQNPFVEDFGDNLVRFCAQQIFSGIKTLNQGNLIHFDIKPDNILIFKGLELKLIDFSFLRKIVEKDGYIAGGSWNFFSPESFQENNQFLNETLKKQDYYAIGLTLFILKYNKFPINGQKKGKSNDENYDITIDHLERALNFIQSQIYQDKEFTKFLSNLIQPKPEKRLNFEQIMRNKWLNKNTEEIKKIIDINNADEDDLLIELQKSDFLMNNRKYYRNEFDKRYNDKTNKEYKSVRKGKFKFGKRNKINKKIKF